MDHKGKVSFLLVLKKICIILAQYGAQAGGSSSTGSNSNQQPGYLPDYRGDNYTNPQRIKDTQALNVSGSKILCLTPLFRHHSSKASVENLNTQAVSHPSHNHMVDRHKLVIMGRHKVAQIPDPTMYRAKLHPHNVLNALQPICVYNLLCNR